MSTASPPLLPISCSQCPRPLVTFVRTTKGALCPDCWKGLGRPGAGGSTPEEAHEAEATTRDHMNRRGGAHRHLVQKGLT